MRDSAIIYRSFFEAIRELPEKNQCECWNAVFQYALDFTEVELTGISKTVFTLIKPQLEANIKRYKNGLEPKKPNKKAKRKQKGSKTEANANVNDNENKNENVNENPSFEDFWNSYDKKVDRKESERKWNKLTQADKEAIMEFIPKYKKFNPDKQFRKHPDSFIFNRTWEDELIQKNGHEEPATVAKGWH